MASVQKRDDRSTATWLVRWRDDAGAQRKRSFPRQADAKRFAATVEADQARGL